MFKLNLTIRIVSVYLAETTSTWNIDFIGIEKKSMAMKLKFHRSVFCSTYRKVMNSSL